MRGLVLVLLLAIVAVGCTVVEIREGDTNEIIVAEDRIINIEKGDVNMKLTSNAFEHGSRIPAKYTCQGDDINPQLKWDSVPDGTKSFALIVDDPDAPRGTWVHWLVKDIPASKREIAEDSVPGTEVENDFGKEGYGGPCPPSGTHRYFFKLYALDTDTFEADSKDDFYNKVDEHKIEEAILMGKYAKG